MIASVVSYLVAVAYTYIHHCLGKRGTGVEAKDSPSSLTGVTTVASVFPFALALDRAVVEKKKLLLEMKTLL